MKNGNYPKKMGVEEVGVLDLLLFFQAIRRTKGVHSRESVLLLLKNRGQDFTS
ncbi:Uncharacterized protein RDABS01_014636 [Bienertia sinuspersici]